MRRRRSSFVGARTLLKQPFPGGIIVLEAGDVQVK